MEHNLLQLLLHVLRIHQGGTFGFFPGGKKKNTAARFLLELGCFEFFLLAYYSFASKISNKG